MIIWNFSTIRTYHIALRSVRKITFCSCFTGYNLKKKSYIYGTLQRQFIMAYLYRRPFLLLWELISTVIYSLSGCHWSSIALTCYSRKVSFWLLFLLCLPHLRIYYSSNMIRFVLRMKVFIDLAGKQMHNVSVPFFKLSWLTIFRLTYWCSFNPWPH